LLVLPFFFPPPSRPVVFVFIGKGKHLRLSEWSCSRWDNIHYWTISGTSWGEKTLPRSLPFLLNRDGGDEQQNVNGHLHFGPWSFESFVIKPLGKL
jgi:hypothetical protein